MPYQSIILWVGNCKFREVNDFIQYTKQASDEMTTWT